MSKTQGRPCSQCGAPGMYVQMSDGSTSACVGVCCQRAQELARECEELRVLSASDDAMASMLYSYQQEKRKNDELRAENRKVANCLHETAVELDELRAREQQLELALGTIYFHARLSSLNPLDKIIEVVEFVMDSEKRTSVAKKGPIDVS